jgi:hypothetical protein
VPGFFVAHFIKCLITATINNIKKMKNITFAIVADSPATEPNPKNPANMAITKKTKAQPKSSIN